MIEVQSNVLFLSAFGVEIDVKNERNRVSRMWQNTYIWTLKIQKLLAADGAFHSHDSTLLCHQLSASESGAPFDQILDPHLTPLEAVLLVLM